MCFVLFLDFQKQSGPRQEDSFDPRETPFNPNLSPFPAARRNNNTPSSARRGGPKIDRRPSSTSLNQRHPAQNQRERPRRGGGRSSSKPSGTIDPYGIDIAPLNIFKNQIIPIGVYNLSKSFRPNMATIRVLSLGTKFIPKWRDNNLKQTFKKIGDFKRRLQNNLVFSETTPGTFCLDKQFHLKTHFVAKDTYNEVDEFCW